MTWFILDNVLEVWMTDPAGVAYRTDILNHQGMSLLSGEIIQIDPPTLVSPIADVVLEVGADPVTVDLRNHFAGEQLTFSRAPALGALDGYSLTLDPVAAMEATEVSVTASNPEGSLADAFMVTFNAPIVVEPEPVARFQAVAPDEDILLVGSSDVGCLTISTWSPWPHNWASIFRNNYTGTMSDPRVEGQSRPGLATAVTYGRMTLPTIVNNAQGGSYGLANPLTEMRLYDALVMDTSDSQFPSFSDPWQYPDMPDYYSITNMPPPYSLLMSTSHQDWLNEEMLARMRLIRIAVGQGITKVFLCSPWPRLGSNGGSEEDDPGDAEWRFKFGSLEDSMHYQQDRLNAQCAFEGLDIEVWLIPFHVFFRDLHDDIAAGTGPAGITSIRNLFALNNNLDAASDVTDPALPKHWYMQNYLGGWALNALFDALVLGGDPSTKALTDGHWTVPQPFADYVLAKVADIAETYERAGPGVGYRGYEMPEILDVAPATLLGADLLGHQADLVPSQSYALARTGKLRQFFAILDLDVSAPRPSETVVEFVSPAGPRFDVSAQITDTGTIDFFLTSAGPGSWEGVVIQRLPFVGPRHRVMLEVYVPFGDWLHPILQLNNIAQATSLDLPNIPYEREKWRVGAHNTAGANNPDFASLVAPHATHRTLEVIASSRYLTGPEVFEVQRYLSRKYQAAIYEPLWPDLIEAV